MENNPKTSMTTTFKDFDLSPGILRALEEKKFEIPTPIQEKVIPQILQSTQDLVALAQTGTGKTAAFSLPVLSQMDPNARHVQTVVLSPTRELAMQIAQDIKGFAKHMPGINVAVVYGGSSIQNQIRDIKRGAQIVVGTPGRMLDLINRKALKLNSVQWAILDEADEMLNMGFVEDISSILGGTPKEKQTLLFSATMSRSIEQIAKKYMHDSMRVEVKATAIRETAISHQFMMVPARDKIAAFQRYKALHSDMYGIVFCRTKRETQEFGDALLKGGTSTGVLHGDIEQHNRTRIMDAFKRKQVTLLVATDVAARGIDVAKLTHVIHVGVPDQIESYVHRSGRTGRANESGISLVLANLREHNALRKIEKMKGIKFKEVTVPKRKEMIKADILDYVQQVEAQDEPSNIAEQYIDEIMKNIPKEEMEAITRKALLLGIEERINRHPEEEMDRPQAPRQSRERGGRERGGSRGMKTLVMSIGRQHTLTVPTLLGMINGVTRGQRVDVGQIQIGDTQTSFEVPPQFVEKLCREIPGRKFKGQLVHVQEGAEVRRSRSSGRYGGPSRRSGSSNRRGSSSGRSYGKRKKARY